MPFDVIFMSSLKLIPWENEGGIGRSATVSGCCFWVLQLSKSSIQKPDGDQHRKNVRVIRHWYVIGTDEQQLRKVLYWTDKQVLWWLQWLVSTRCRCSHSNVHELPLSCPILGRRWTKRQWGWEVTLSLAILNLVEPNLHPRLCPRYSLFLCWKGTLISQTTNHDETRQVCLGWTVCFGQSVCQLKILFR